MATENAVGGDVDGAVRDGDQISLAQLTALCHEIDESWTEEEVKKCIGDFYCTDRGFIKIRPEPDWVQVDMMGVLPEYRGTGHSRVLMQIAEDVALALGLCGVGLATISPQIFARLGFEPTGMLPGAARGKDLTIMFKEIQENVFDSKKVIA